MHRPTPGGPFQVDGTIARIAGVSPAIRGEEGAALKKTKMTVLRVRDVPVVGLDYNRPGIAEDIGVYRIVAPAVVPSIGGGTAVGVMEAAPVTSVPLTDNLMLLG